MNYRTCPYCGKNGLPAKGKAIMPFGESEFCRECKAWFEVPSYLVLIINLPLVVLAFASLNMIFAALALLFTLVISVIFYKYMPLKHVRTPRKTLYNWVVIFPLILGLYYVNFIKEIAENQKLYILISSLALTSFFDYIYTHIRRKTSG